MELCRRSLNPNISIEAVDEMLIQHLMTERIIRRVFDVAHFAQTNVIAANIEEVIRALTSSYFNRSRVLWAACITSIKPSKTPPKTSISATNKPSSTPSTRSSSRATASTVADTHGIVYTPQEIVDFMCAAVEEVAINRVRQEAGR